MHLHLDDLFVEVDAAVVHHLHHPLLLAGWADLGLLDVPQDVLHQLLVLAVVALETGVAAPMHPLSAPVENTHSAAGNKSTTGYWDLQRFACWVGRSGG